MPLYELLALGVPRLPKEEVARMIQRLGRAVYDRGGVITDVKSYGEQPLAYKVRGTSGKYDQAHIWQLDFAVAPQALADLRHELRVDERLLRWAVVKRRRAAPRLPPPREMFHRDPSFGAVLRPEGGGGGRRGGRGQQHEQEERALPDVSALFEEDAGRAAAAGVIASSMSAGR